MGTFNKDFFESLSQVQANFAHIVIGQRSLKWAPIFSQREIILDELLSILSEGQVNDHTNSWI